MTENAPEHFSVANQRDSSKLGVWFFLGGEVIFFSTLIATFIMFRVLYPSEYPAFSQHLSVPIIGVNTFVLITSSFMVVRALSAIQNGSNRSMVINLMAVMALGLLFLGGQAFEWTTLFRSGVGITDRFGTPFFTVTGIHGTHVFIGLIWAAVLLYMNGRKRFTANSHKALELFGLYWHFVDIVWIVLFTVIYLI